MAEHADVLVDAESQNTGKIRSLTRSEELDVAIDQVRFFAGAARMLEGRAGGEYMEGFTSYVRREPIGVVGQVTPWNYPLMMAVWKIAPALAAGNTVVIKPSDTTPVSTALLGRDRPGGAAAGRPERGLRRPRHRPGARRAPDPGTGPHHRLDPRRHRGGPVRGCRRETHPPRARRQGAGRGVRRRRLRRGRRGHRRRRLLQRGPGLHGGLPGAVRGSPCTTCSWETAGRLGARQRATGPARGRLRVVRSAQQRPPAGAGSRSSSRPCPTTPPSRSAAAARPGCPDTGVLPRGDRGGPVFARRTESSRRRSSGPW